MSSRAWLLPLGVIVACIPCFLIPVTASLIAGGAFGGALGLLGVPWVLALVIAAPLVLAVAVMSVRRRVSAPSPPCSGTASSRRCNPPARSPAGSSQWPP